MKSFYKASLLALALFGLTASAQSLKFDEDAQKAPHIMASKDVVEVNYNAGFSTVAGSASEKKPTATSPSSPPITWKPLPPAAHPSR